MYELMKIENFKVDSKGTQILMSTDKDIGYVITEKHIKNVEIRFGDGRHISNEQRKKAYATMRDIADWTGYLPEEQKECLKWLHMMRTGCNYFSLSDCTMDTAREFINTILEYAIQNGVPLGEAGVNRTDDIGRYLYYCLKHKKCAVCGRDGEIHHVDTIGMGNDRSKVDDTNYRKICLCREHHTIAHKRGNAAFEQMYKVYGIIFN